MTDAALIFSILTNLIWFILCLRLRKQRNEALDCVDREIDSHVITLKWIEKNMPARDHKTGRFVKR